MGTLSLLYTGTWVQYKIIAKHQGSDLREISVLILLLMSGVILSKLWKRQRPQFLYLQNVF